MFGARTLYTTTIALKINNMEFASIIPVMATYTATTAQITLAMVLFFLIRTIIMYTTTIAQTTFLAS